MLGARCFERDRCVSHQSENIIRSMLTNGGHVSIFFCVCFSRVVNTIRRLDRLWI